MRGSEKISEMVEYPTADAYQRKANKFYNVKDSGQTAAVVETVFRKPKEFANLHEYDDTVIIDQVPTAIGFNSFDSADEVMEEKMKTRYQFEEPTKKEEQLRRQIEESNPSEKGKVSNKGENEETGSFSPEQPHVPFHKLILRKVENRAPRDKVEEKRRVVEPDVREDSMEKKNNEEEEVEDAVNDNDRYDLGQSNFSDDDSCPPLWKSFSNESDGKLDDAAKEKARRQIALNKARKLRALNSVNSANDPTPLETDMGVDPRLRRNTTQGSGLKQTSPMQDKSSSNKVIGRGNTGKSRQEPVQKKVIRSNNRKDSVSVLSNSIVTSQPPPRKVEVKAMTFDRRFDDASYGSEGQSKGSDDGKQHTISTETNRLADTEQSIAACVYEGLTNLTNLNYWMGEQASSDDNQQGSEDESLEAVKVSSNTNRSGTAKRDSKATKSSRAIVSEITIPTPAIRVSREPRMEDSVSILGLDKKQSNKGTMENGENRVPQKQKKRKGKSRVFGKILGRKTAA